MLAAGHATRASRDQAAMFARGELKTVAFTAKDVEAGAVVRYRPGAPQ